MKQITDFNLFNLHCYLGYMSYEYWFFGIAFGDLGGLNGLSFNLGKGGIVIGLRDKR